MSRYVVLGLHISFLDVQLIFLSHLSLLDDSVKFVLESVTIHKYVSVLWQRTGRTDGQATDSHSSYLGVYYLRIDENYLLWFATYSTFFFQLPHPFRWTWLLLCSLHTLTVLSIHFSHFSFCCSLVTVYFIFVLYSFFVTPYSHFLVSIVHW